MQIQAKTALQGCDLSFMCYAIITLSLDCDEMQPRAKRNKRHEQLPTALWELEAEGQVKCTVRFKWI